MSAADNRAKAFAYAEKLKEKGIQNIINGEHLNALSGETFETSSPMDNQVITKVASGNADDINQAAKAAAEAFPAWRDMPAKKRRDVLHAVGDLIEKNADEISLLEVLDTGQTIRFMSKAAIRGAANFRFFADKCEDARNGKCRPT